MAPDQGSRPDPAPPRRPAAPPRAAAGASRATGEKPVDTPRKAGDAQRAPTNPRKPANPSKPADPRDPADPREPRDAPRYTRYRAGRRGLPRGKQGDRSLATGPLLDSGRRGAAAGPGAPALAGDASPPSASRSDCSR